MQGDDAKVGTDVHVIIISIVVSILVLLLLLSVIWVVRYYKSAKMSPSGETVNAEEANPKDG